MKTFKTILIYFLSAFVILSLLLYLVLIFIVPEYLEDNICSVTGICTETENLKIEITPALRVKLDADIVKSGDSIYVEKIHASADIKKLAVQSINADYIFIDGNKFAHKKSSNSSFNLNKIPEINIKRLEYISKSINLNIQDISYDGHLAKFKGEAKLRFDILKEIKERIPNTPIVLHGASTVIPELVEMCNKYGGDIPGAKGVPDEILHEASKSGVSKINVDTDLRLAMTAGIRKEFTEEPNVFDPRKYLGPARELIKETVKHKMIDVFGSSNKI